MTKLPGIDTTAACPRKLGAAPTVLFADRVLPHLVFVVLLFIATLSCCPCQTCKHTDRQCWLAEALQTCCRR